MTNTQPIQTSDKIIRVEGKVFVTDQRHRIDVKKPIRDLFNNIEDVRYVMELCLSELKLSERIKELGQENVVPVLMYFVKEGKDAVE